MTENFDPKVFQGKKRIYEKVIGKTNILRLYVWSGDRYIDPGNGKKYDARRVEIGENGKRRRKKRLFKTLDEATLWQQGHDPNVVAIKSAVSLEEHIRSCETVSAGGMTFAQLIEKFRSKQFPKLELSTQVRYDRLMNATMGTLQNLAVLDTKPQTIDLWLSGVMESKSEAPQRKFFKHELDMLKTLLWFYKEYHDDENRFVLPFRKRHAEDARNGHKRKPVADLNLEQFWQFRESVLNVKYGGKFAVMSTCQFHQALRISEAAGLMFEDFKLDFEKPERSRVVISRAVKWERDTGLPTTTGDLKNSDAVDGAKEQPVFPEVFQVLTAMFPDFSKRRGFIFVDEDGKLFEYRQIQRAYDRAFEIAGLDFTGTHIMRHGGCRALLNETGDRYVAQQHLGNSSLQSTDVYAKRTAKALTEAVEKRWKVISDSGRSR